MSPRSGSARRRGSQGQRLGKRLCLMKGCERWFRSGSLENEILRSHLRRRGHCLGAQAVTAEVSEERRRQGDATRSGAPAQGSTAPPVDSATEDRPGGASDHRGSRGARRGSYPSPPSRFFSVRPARLLHRVSPDSSLSAATVLFTPLRQGVTASRAARSALASLAWTSIEPCTRITLMPALSCNAYRWTGRSHP